MMNNPPVSPRQRLIRQIIPAEGWYACYREEDDTLGYQPLICWALFDDEHGRSRVAGLVAGLGGVVSCEENRQFIGYEHVSRQDNIEPP